MIFVFLPIISSILLSLTNYSGGGLRFKFIGLQNYLRVFASTKFHRALWVTLKFVLFTVSFQLFLGFIFALVLNQHIRGKNLFRSIIFLPSIISTIAVSLAFMLIFHPQKGVLNYLLGHIHIDPLPWLTSPNTALMSIIIVAVWQSFGYYMVLFLSGLQSISPRFFEAAELDGANSRQKLIHITIPMLSPVTFFCVIIAVIRAFQVFDQIFIMTGGQYGGGPAGSTTVLVFDIYLNAFCHFQMGYASAESVVLLLIVLTITLIQYRGQRKWVIYDLA